MRACVCVVSLFFSAWAGTQDRTGGVIRLVCGGREPVWATTMKETPVNHNSLIESRCSFKKNFEHNWWIRHLQGSDKTRRSIYWLLSSGTWEGSAEPCIKDTLTTVQPGIHSHLGLSHLKSPAASYVTYSEGIGLDTCWLYLHFSWKYTFSSAHLFLCCSIGFLFTPAATHWSALSISLPLWSRLKYRSSLQQI